MATSTSSDQALLKHMATHPEGFWWFQKGEYDERKVEQDVRERLPNWYADHGYVDFQVTQDSLISDSTGGKAILHLTVDEGQITGWGLSTSRETAGSRPRNCGRSTRSDR